MRQYSVSYTEQAENDLRGIFEYLAFSCAAPDTAGKQSNRIIDAIAGLNHIPERFRLYDNEPWCSKGLRIIYGRRDIDKELRK